jgi:hypothetical protein
MITEILTQAELQTRLKRMMRDTQHERYSSVETYDAINSALQKWGPRVLIPYVYTLADWDSNTREYELPTYVHQPLDAQFKLHDELTWQSFPAYDVQADGSGDNLLALAFFPPNADARVVWWGRNSPVPTTLATLSNQIVAADTTMQVTGVLDVADAGYVKIDFEWIQYAGRVKGSGVTVFSNLQRGCFDTTAATHNSSTTMYWGVAVHRADLYEQLFHQACAYLFGLFLTEGSAQEREQHQFNMRWHQQEAHECWKLYTPSHSPKFILSREAIGPVYSGYPHTRSDSQYRWWWP